MSSLVLAEKWGTNHHTVKDAVVRAGGAVRRPGHIRRVGHRLVQKNGRQIMVTLDPADPMIAMAYRGLRVAEHRLVMARSLGRPLLREEHVHHINGNPQDNRLANLQLRHVATHGSGAAFVCLDCGSHNVAAVELAAEQGV